MWLPAGMIISPAGLIGWQPAANQLGNNLVQVRVEDGRGGLVLQNFTVEVTTQGANDSPVILSTPLPAATVNRPYRYDLRAIDPDGDPFVWLFDQAPTGMSINATQGTVRWTPNVLQVGDHDVVVRVLDTQGGTSTQRFTVSVRAANLPPAITSVPSVDTATNEIYTYAVGAIDPEGDPLTFSLSTAAERHDHRCSVRLDHVDLPNTGSGPGDRSGGRWPGRDRDPELFPGCPPDRHQPSAADQLPGRGMRAVAGELYQFQVMATDPEGQAISYSFGQLYPDLELPPRRQG